MLSSELELLKDNMRQKKYDALLVPREDMFSGEEVPKSEERLKYITNFTGSAGFAIIVSNINLKSAIFSDGRYQLQLKKQVDAKFFDVFNGGINEIGNFLKDNEKFLKIIAFDPWLLTSKKHETLSKILKSTPLILKPTEKNLIDEIWKKRPTENQKSIFQLPLKRTGENVLSKINRLKKVITNIDCDYYVLFNPAGLSWLLNIRCRDLEYTPVSRSFCIISSEGEVFIFSDNSTFEIITKNHSKIHLLQINELTSFLKKLKNKNFLIDPVFLPLQIKYLISNMGLNIHSINCPIEEFKSVKNSKEITSKLVAKVKELEFKGYQFEAADASLELILRRLSGEYRPFFKVLDSKVHIFYDEYENENTDATLKVLVGGDIEHTASDGDGPVDALNKALRKALSKFFPVLEDVRLTDYKVRVLNEQEGTSAKVRVLIESAYGDESWSTIGVSKNIIEASRQALSDSFNFRLASLSNWRKVDNEELQLFK